MVIDFQSVVAAADLEPFVQFRWGGELGQLSVAEARFHALAILQAAEAAESDSAIARLFVEQHGFTPAQVMVGVVAPLREFRGSRRSQDWTEA